MSYNTINSNNFVDFVFQNEPKPIKSINLEFETDNLKDLFENLLDIFTNGMKIHYGNSDGTVDLSSLTQENIVNFNKYFNSFGISLIIQIDNNAVINGADYQSIKYTNINITNETKLSDLKLPFLSSGIVYIISFDFI
tara:strand:+ start:190 stop:603 length:414 start_codon:yes stop_codon:yes gene_type:complete